jgi:predicted nucleotidyltransferase
MESLSPSLRQEIIQRLVAEFKPEAIYLFGSHAWGVPGPDSDLDLFVIIPESDQKPVERVQRALRSLRGLMAPIDILVKTRAEFDRYRSVYASLDAQVYEMGKLRYGSQTRAGKDLA